MMQTTACYESYSFRNPLCFPSLQPLEFELGWRLHAEAGQAERGVAALGVVVALDELEDFHACLRSGVEGLAVEQLALEGGEEGLGHRVIEAIAATAHGLDQARLADAPTVCKAGVLPGFKQSSQQWTVGPRVSV